MPGAMTRPSEVSRLTQASSAAGSALSEQTGSRRQADGRAISRWRQHGDGAGQVAHAGTERPEEMPAAGARAGRERS